MSQKQFQSLCIDLSYLNDDISTINVSPKHMCIQHVYMSNVYSVNHKSIGRGDVFHLPQDFS